LYVELDKGTGQLLWLPGRRGVAGAQPDYRIANAHRLARLECHVAAFAVTLVEYAQHSDAIGHRRCALFGVDILGRVDGNDASGGVVIHRRARRRAGRRCVPRLGATDVQPCRALPRADAEHRRQGNAAGNPTRFHPSGDQAS